MRLKLITKFDARFWQERVVNRRTKLIVLALNSSHRYYSASRGNHSVAN